MNALTIVKRAGKRRGAVSAYTLTSVINGQRVSITVIARNGCEALARFRHQMGDSAPRVLA